MGTNPDASKYTEDTPYEVQPWENVDNSGSYEGSMAGDNSLNSDKNTYTGPTEAATEPSYTYTDPTEYGLGDMGGSTDMGDYENYGEIAAGGGDYGGGDMGGSTDVGEYGGGDFMSAYGGGYGGRDEDLDRYVSAADGGLMNYAHGGSAHPFFSKETGKYNYHAPQMYAMGGLGSLGGYSDGGRLLKGPGDGVSDSIPATIGANKQPARLADGEFVVPARIVSELGNGSTEAGARKLYAMMDRIQKSRGKTVGKGKVATNTRADKHLPA
jgi:hypothetical protein